MTIWLLGLLLMASGAGLGFRQGAIRVAFSFVAILVGALVSPPLGRLVQPMLVSFGLKTPPLAWLLAPVLVFILVSVLFKIGALAVHQKVDVYFKYRTGELRLALFERLNRRVGLCLGILNGVAYLVILSFLIYTTSYWTYQIASSETDPTTMRVLNRLGQDLQRSGFDKVAKAVDAMPQVWYDAADLAGLIYSNPMSEAALARYPAFLSLAERAEFKDLGADGVFGELRLKRAPVMEVIHYAKIQAMLENTDFLSVVWQTVVPDMKDLCTFLETGQSPKYDPEKILGRWKLDVTGLITAFRRIKPNVSAKEMIAVRRAITAAFEKTGFVAMTDGRAILKSAPPLRLAQGAGVSLQNYDGRWKNVSGKYELSLSVGGGEQDLPATVEGDRLTVLSDGVGFVFNRED